jgi:hypothetical protein
VARTGRAIAWAFGLSFSVYLIPLVGPHAVWFLGEALWHSWSRGDKAVTWRLMEWAVALVLQTTAGATWYWVLRRPRGPRALALLVAVPAVAVANGLYQAVLPARFLIAPDTAREERHWPLLCSIPDEALVTPGSKPAVVRAPGDVLIAQSSTGRLARVVIQRASDGRTTCEVAPLGLVPLTGGVTPAWIGEDGRALLSRTERSGGLSWEWTAGPGMASTPLDAPAGRRAGDPGPVISRDGAAVAWLVPVPDSGQPPSLSVVVRSLVPSARLRSSAAGPDRAADIVVPLDRIERGGVVVLDVDMSAREVLLAIGERRFAAIGFDGVPRWGPVRPDGVEALSMTFRRVGPGWVAWDGYRDRGAYALAWVLPAGRGVHHVPEGRGITDVAVHPGGRFIAISVTTSLSIGSVADSVYVLRAADGAQVFRRFLPRYARSSVAFQGDDLFAYTEWDGARAALLVLRLPT